MTTSRTASPIAIAVLTFSTLLAATSRAEVLPDWIARVPAGTSLSAGPRGFVVDAGGVSYITGTSGPSSNTDILTAAFAPDGTTLWTHTFNGPEDWHDQARGITLGPGGSVYVTGNTPGPGRVATVLVLEYDGATGELLSTIQYSSVPGTSEHGQSIATDASGNLYVAGGTTGDGGDALIVKFDADGVFQWKRVWDGPASAPFSQDHGEEILIGPDGNPVVRIYGVAASLRGDFVVVKYDAGDGSTIWETTWGVPGEDAANDMEIDGAGDVYVTGVGLDFITKFSTLKLRGSDGQLLWQEYDAPGFRNSASSITLDRLGGVYVTGSVDPDGDRSNFNNDMYTVKREGDAGALQWSHRFGDPCVGCFDVPSDVIVDPAGNVFVAGSTSSPPYGGALILFVLDAATGLEKDRGILEGGSGEGAGAGSLAFDDSFRLYNGGGIQNRTTGEVEMTVVRYPSWVEGLYRMTVTDLVVGSPATFAVRDATPEQKQFLVFSLRGPGSTPVPRLGVTLDVKSPRLITAARADAGGSLETTLTVPPRAAGRTIWFQAAENGRTTPVLRRTVP